MPMLVGLTAFNVIAVHQADIEDGRLEAAVIAVLATPLARQLISFARLDPGSRAGDLLEEPWAVPHAAAVIVAATSVPWIAVAALLGADLSVRVGFYEQITQVIPVLLLTLIVERRFFEVERLGAGEREDVRIGFFVLVFGAIGAEIAALLAVASDVSWIEVVATILSSATIPGMLVLVSGTVLIGLYRPETDGRHRREAEPSA